MIGGCERRIALRRATSGNERGTAPDNKSSYPRMRVSSTPRLLDSIAGASGILDHPPSRVMTIWRHNFAISRHLRPEFCLKLPALFDQRAQGMPGAQCARSLVCSVLVAHECRHHGHTGKTPGIPCAMVLTVSFVLSPVTNSFLSPSGRPIRHPDLDNRLSP
jgi:hypothetical protein